MTRHPLNLPSAVALGGPYRAGGVDLLRAGIRTGVVDLKGLPGLRRVAHTGDGLVLGALTTLRDLEHDRLLGRRWPALAGAASAVANPNVRAVATVGGNLLQAVRCAHPDGGACPLRHDHRAVCFDTGDCAAPHPSTLAAALICHGATARVEGRGDLPVVELVAGGLALGEVLTSIAVPAPPPDERAYYLRVSPRALADWPLVEVVVRGRGGTTVEEVRVVAGAVAPVPVRLEEVERSLVGGPVTGEALRAAAARAGAGATPAPGGAHKLRVLAAAVFDALSACWPDR